MARTPLPVVALAEPNREQSALAMKALELGAVEVVEKPMGERFGPLVYRLLRVLKGVADAKPRPHAPDAAFSVEKAPLGPPSQVLVAMGASIGGTEALVEILKNLPEEHPGMVVALQMPQFVMGEFIRLLDRQCALRVREAQEGDLVRDGLVLIAPGDRHLVVNGQGGKFRISCPDGPAVHFQKPSLDVLFHSVARCAGPDAIGVLLTGMGTDGAGGLLAMREAGSFTLAQDEATSVLYDMPGEALSRGAVDEVVPLHVMSVAIAARTSVLAGRK
jgi:two-component system chemotaxis response regulator CheB